MNTIMKKLALTLLVVLSASAIWAQSKTIENFHSKYHEDRDAKVVSLSGNLFQLIGSMASFDEESEDAKTIARIADGIKSLDILAIPMHKSGFGAKDVEQMRADLKKEKYEELMTVRDGSDNVYFLTQGNDLFW